jgi:hypothetical protein
MLTDQRIVRRFFTLLAIALAGTLMGCSGAATDKDPASEGAREAPPPCSSTR